MFRSYDFYANSIFQNNQRRNKRRPIPSEWRNNKELTETDGLGPQVTLKLYRQRSSSETDEEGRHKLTNHWMKTVLTS